MKYAGRHKYLTYISWVLSAISTLVALVPFIYIWRIIHDVMASDLQNITHYGWMAVLFAVVAVVIYIGGLICSHMSAFRIAANLRKTLMRHITALPLGAAESFGSGNLRKIVQDSSEATETYLAHRLPDKAGAIATNTHGTYRAAFDIRLAARSFEPYSRSFGLCNNVKNDRQGYGGKAEGIQQCA